MTLPDLDLDPGEQILGDIEAAVGTRPDGCPWRSLRDPFVQRVVHARAGRDRFGPTTPAILAQGVDAFEAALNAVEVADAREDRAQAERKRAEAEKNAGRPPMMRARLVR